MTSVMPRRVPGCPGPLPSGPWRRRGGCGSAARSRGYQYLLIVGLVAGARPAGGDRVAPLPAVAALVNVALLGGLGLNAAAHLHDGGPLSRAVLGAYTGLVMAHFVIDAGLWRLRDAFPRAFLARRLPYLLAAR